MNVLKLSFTYPNSPAEQVLDNLVTDLNTELSHVIGYLNYRTVSASLESTDVSVLSTDVFVSYDSESYGQINLLLPKASIITPGRIFYFKDSKGYGGSADTTVTQCAGDTIDNSGDSIILNNGNDWLILVCDGISNWMIMSIGYR